MKEQFTYTSKIWSWINVCDTCLFVLGTTPKKPLECEILLWNKASLNQLELIQTFLII